MRLVHAVVCALSVSVVALSCSDDPHRPCPTSAPALAGGFYSHSALPTGACESGKETCELAVLDCDVPGSFGPINSYVCSCTSGTWTCHVDVAGSGTCLPSDWPGSSTTNRPASDAATEAAADGATDASASDGGTTN
jgi:hypothetical protein